MGSIVYVIIINRSKRALALPQQRAGESLVVLEEKTQL